MGTRKQNNANFTGGAATAKGEGGEGRKWLEKGTVTWENALVMLNKGRVVLLTLPLLTLNIHQRRAARSLHLPNISTESSGTLALRPHPLTPTNSRPPI